MANYIISLGRAVLLSASLLGIHAPSKAGIGVEAIPYCQFPNTATFGPIPNQLDNGDVRYTTSVGIAPMGSYMIGQIQQNTFTIDGKTGNFKDVINHQLARQDANPFVVGTLDAMLADKIDDFMRNKKECMPTS
ncbi:MAG TPA: hypothetical protein VJB12_05905 [Candidatus Nanoarchaeia archaeon]|nr:hypothetical protein [Candidatus Nanoarchaeia archaeon]